MYFEYLAIFVENLLTLKYKLMKLKMSKNEEKILNLDKCLLGQNDLKCLKVFRFKNKIFYDNCGMQIYKFKKLKEGLKKWRIVIFWQN